MCSKRFVFALLAHCQDAGVHAVDIKNASRFVPDLIVQMTGHKMLGQWGIKLISVDVPSEQGATSDLVRQMLGAFSQFERAMLVAKLRSVRKIKRAETGRCKGRKSVPAEVVIEARRLSMEMHPITGKMPSLLAIAESLAALELTGPTGKSYFPNSLKAMLASRAFGETYVHSVKEVPAE